MYPPTSESSLWELCLTIYTPGLPWMSMFFCQTSYIDSWSCAQTGQPLQLWLSISAPRHLIKPPGIPHTEPACGADLWSDVSMNDTVIKRTSAKSTELAATVTEKDSRLQEGASLQNSLEALARKWETSSMPFAAKRNWRLHFCPWTGCLKLCSSYAEGTPSSFYVKTSYGLPWSTNKICMVPGESGTVVSA